jgi:hypothetical protein
MNYINELYKKIGDWFQERPNDLIPKDDPEYQILFAPGPMFCLQAYDLKGLADKDYYETVHCEHVNLPLIVAFQAGLRGKLLVEIAKHHRIDVYGLIETLDAMRFKHYEMPDAFGGDVPLSSLYIECVKVASEAFPDMLTLVLKTQNSVSGLNLYSIHSENPEHWPVTRLTEHMKNMEQGTVAPDYRINTDCYNISSVQDTDEYLPTDASGIRYDLYLERSGMLLPEVARKKIGNVTLWEDMLDVATADDDQGMSGLFNYCIKHAPEHLRPAIYRGLAGMTLACSGYLTDGLGLFKYFKAKTAGTWLEPISHNPLFINSLMGNHILTLNRITIAFHSAAQPKTPPQSSQDDMNDLLGRSITSQGQMSALMEHCLTLIMNKPVDEIGSSEFQIALLEKQALPEQVFSEDFRAEPAIVHMLKALESFTLPEKVGILRKNDLDEAALNSCAYVARTLANHVELDYRAFAGLSSSGIRVLAEAGLDKRKLPRMNTKDRGILVSQELGL